MLTAMIMRQYSAQNIDLLRVLEMVAVHDLVEIDAGDTVAYDAAAQITKAVQNASAGGGSWRSHSLHRDQVLKRMAPIESAMPEIWPVVLSVVDAFCEAGVIQQT